MIVSLTANRFPFNVRQWGDHGPHTARSATDEVMVVILVIVVVAVVVIVVVVVAPAVEEKKNVTIHINHPYEAQSIIN